MKNKIQGMLSILLFLAVLFTACSDMISDQEGYGSAGNSPGISGLSAAAGSESVTLSWEDPVTGFDHIEVTWTPDGTATETVAAGAQTYTAAGLKNGDEYMFTVRSVDGAGAMTSQDSVSATPVIPGAPANALYIYTPEDLYNVRNDLAGYYILMADLDLSDYASGEGWEPVGTCYYYVDMSGLYQPMKNGFAGTFNGNGHTISGLTINRSNNYTQGLFGCLDGGTINNLGVTNYNLSGKSDVGGLVGYNDTGTISYCYTSGSVSGGDSAGDVGGLVGFNVGGTINYCHATGTTSSDGNSAGGLVGYNSRGTINYCYATGSASSGNSLVGGLVGFNVGGTINYCYATGSANGYWYIGGLVGYNYSGGTINYCYATGSVSGTGSYIFGLIGDIGDGTVLYSYFNSANSDNGMGTAVSLEDMRLQSTYDGWDFTGETVNGSEDIWSIGTLNSGYPYLTNNAPGE